jgi:hypothetical protein
VEVNTFHLLDKRTARVYVSLVVLCFSTRLADLTMIIMKAYNKGTILLNTLIVLTVGIILLGIRIPTNVGSFLLFIGIIGGLVILVQNTSNNELTNEAISGDKLQENRSVTDFITKNEEQNTITDNEYARPTFAAK